MPKLELFSKYGLVGDNLEFKKDVKIKINELGNIEDISFNEIEEEINLVNRKFNTLLIPGLINSHIHIGDSFAKEQGFNRKLKEIVAPPNGLKHKLLNSISRESLEKGIKNAILEMLSNGITCFIDFREGGTKGLEISKKLLKGTQIDHLTLGRYLKKDEINKIFSLADGIGLPSYNHVNQQIKKELKKCKEKFGKIIACHIAELKRDGKLIEKAITDKLIDVFIHGTHFIKKDVKTLKRESKSLILCPRSNGYFGVGFPPIAKILKSSVPLAIGTDNIMNNSPDLFEELRYLYRILRVQDNNLLVSGKDLLKMVTVDAAKIFNILPHVGSISKGKKANLCVINLSDPNFYVSKLDIENIYALIIGRTNSFNIKKTYIGGQLVHEKRF